MDIRRSRAGRRATADRLGSVAAAACLASGLGSVPVSTWGQTPGPVMLSAGVTQGALVMRLDREVAREEGRLAVWVDRHDVSALLQRTGAGEWILPPSAFALLPSAARVDLFLVTHDDWRALASQALSAPAPTEPAPGMTGAAGAATATVPAWKPRIDLALKAQLRAHASGSEPLPARPTYRDATLRAALEVDQPLGAATLRGSAQVAGSSYRAEALRYTQRRTEAPKVDLAEYRFELAGNPLSLTAGHQGIGNHPLLLDRFASRGISAGARGAAGWDLSLAAVNGSAIAGYDNPLGLAEPDHQVHLLVAGQELDPARPGWLRAEVSLMDASIQALGNFNRGEVPDAEKIRGLGLRLLGKLLDGRARVDLSAGRARHRAAEDPQLASASAGPLVPLASSTRSAWSAEVGFDLVQGWTGLAQRLPVTLTLQLRHALVEPLYKTVGAFLGADQKLNRIALQASAGGAQVQVFADRKDDNVERIASLLTTRTGNRGLTLSLPAATWSADPAAAWVPGLTLQVLDNSQRALDAPDFAVSGLAATHRPDQVNRSAQMGLNWAVDRITFGLNGLRSRQDNRQPGREKADFEIDGLAGQLGLPLGDQVNLALGAGRQRNLSLERQLTEVADNATLALDWRADERWALALALSAQRGRDSVGNATSRALGVQTQLTRRFSLAAPGAAGMALPGQWFLRHGWASSRRTDKVFGFAADGRQWSLQAGIGLSFAAP